MVAWKKRSHHRNREKKRERLARVGLRRSIALSTDTEDMTSMASGGVEHSVSEGASHSLDDAVPSSSTLSYKADAGARAAASVVLVGPSEG